MCNLCVPFPCFNSFDFLNWYFQPIRIKYSIKTWLEKQKKRQNFARILQKFCKNCKNSAKNTMETP